MNDVTWRKYTDEGNAFLERGQKCCAYRFYQSALTEAEHLLMNSYEIDEKIPVIPILMISYQNLFNLLESEGCYQDLESYLGRATERFSGVLHSPEFPLNVWEDCCQEIYKLYNSLSYFSLKFRLINTDCNHYMNYIKDAVLYYSKTYQSKKN